MKFSLQKWTNPRKTREKGYTREKGTLFFLKDKQADRSNVAEYGEREMVVSPV